MPRQNKEKARAYNREYWHRVRKYKLAGTEKYKEDQKRKNRSYYERVKNNPDLRRQYRVQQARNMQKYLQDPCFRARVLARKKAQHAMRTGRLKKEKCSQCGSEKSEMHHRDYTQPFLVQWLCRPCHVKAHH